MQESATFLQMLFDTALVFLIYKVVQKVNAYPYEFEIKDRRWLYLLMFIFCLFPFFGGDYFHYIENFIAAKSGGFAHIEDIYVWFIQKCCPSYLFFRIGVWGLALLLVVAAYKRIDSESDLSIGFFALLYLPWFSYARASLAMAFIFFGLSFLCSPINNKKLLSYVIGLLSIGCSVFFHRSAAIGIIAALLAVLLRNPSKRKLLLIIVLFPVALFFMTAVLSNFMSLDLGYDDYISGRQRDDYLTGDAHGGISMGIGPYLMTFLTRAPLFLIAFTFAHCVLKGHLQNFSNSTKIASFYSFIIVVIAFAFSFDLGYNTYSLYYRTLVFAMIPSAVFLAQLKKIGCVPTLFKVCYYATLLGVFYTMIYRTYATLVS